MTAIPNYGQRAIDDPMAQMRTSLEDLMRLPNHPAEAPWGDPNEPGIIKAVIYGAIDVDGATCTGLFACVGRVGTMLVGAIRPTEQAQRRGFYPEHGFIDVRQLDPWSEVVLVPGELRFGDWLGQNHASDAQFDAWLGGHALPPFGAIIWVADDRETDSPDVGGL